MADLDGDGKSEIIALDDYDKLKVLQAGGKQIWKSDETFGGSLIYVGGENPQASRITSYNVCYTKLLRVTKQPEEPINVEADQMVSKQNENAVVFSGNVDAKQGMLHIHADQMTVYHQSESASAKKEQNGSQKIEKLYADVA